MHTTDAPCHGSDDSPADRLKKVVGAGENAESVAERNASRARTRWSKSAKSQVIVKIGNFGEL